MGDPCNEALAINKKEWTDDTCNSCSLAVVLMMSGYF